MSIRKAVKRSNKNKSRFYQMLIDNYVKPDLTRKVEPEVPLPGLVENGYHLLGLDWLETLKKWKKRKERVPPVMITVANNTYTAARVEFFFKHKKLNNNDALCDPEGLLHIDSRVID